MARSRKSTWTTSSVKPWKSRQPRQKTQPLRQPIGWEEPLYEDVKAALGQGNRHPRRGRSGPERVPWRRRARCASRPPRQGHPQGQNLQARHLPNLGFEADSF